MVVLVVLVPVVVVGVPNATYAVDICFSGSSWPFVFLCPSYVRVRASSSRHTRTPPRGGLTPVRDEPNQEGRYQLRSGARREVWGWWCWCRSWLSSFLTPRTRLMFVFLVIPGVLCLLSSVCTSSIRPSWSPSTRARPRGGTAPVSDEQK